MILSRSLIIGIIYLNVIYLLGIDAQDTQDAQEKEKFSDEELTCSEEFLQELESFCLKLSKRSYDETIELDPGVFTQVERSPRIKKRFIRSHNLIKHVCCARSCSYEEMVDFCAKTSN